MSGKLFVMATPIGNLSDITLRAIEVLKSVDFVACEDTRQTVKLLNHLDIKKPLVSYHQHSRVEKIDSIIGRISAGENAAIVSDAGTPGISDPGGTLVKAAQEAAIEVVAIPGPSALGAAISVSGLNLQEFVFVGFLPQKKGRQTKLKALSVQKIPVIFYESPYRIIKLLSEIQDFFGDRRVVVARELTKIYETIYHGKISEIGSKITAKGEFVIIVEGADGKNDHF